MWFTDIAQKRPLPEAESQPRIKPRVVLYHTMVGGLLGTERYFREGTGIESHFGVGGPWDGPELDGVIFQWMSTDRQADANLDANSFAISIETSDNAPRLPENIAPWSPKQLAALIRLGSRLAEHYNIPRRQVPVWDGSGYGWHAMFGAPSHYTPIPGKVCPGPARIRQLKEIVFPAIFHGTQPPEVDDMTPAQAELLEKVAKDVAELKKETVLTRPGQDTMDGVWYAWRRLNWGTETLPAAPDRITYSLKDITDRLARVEELVTPPEPPPPPA